MSSPSAHQRQDMSVNVDFCPARVQSYYNVLTSADMDARISPSSSRHIHVNLSDQSSDEWVDFEIKWTDVVSKKFVAVSILEDRILLMCSDGTAKRLPLKVDSSDVDSVIVDQVAECLHWLYHM